MKRCKNITGWTDYPFEELGDIGYEKAPIRQINVVSYDGDKYATITIKGGDGTLLYVKAGYLYSNHARLGEGANPISRLKLERMIIPV